MYNPIRSKLDELAIKKGYFFDEKPAIKVKRFIEKYCIQSKHPFNGVPLKLFDWEFFDYILPLYGWFRPEKSKNGERIRRYSAVSCWVPKKQGKSSLNAALALHSLMEYPGSEVYVIASNVRQANIIFGQAKEFILNHDALGGPGATKKGKGRLWIRNHIRTIEEPEQKSKLQILPCSPEVSGFNANALICDEIIDWGAYGREAWNKIHDAGSARINSIRTVISTAGFDRSTVAYEQYQYAKNIKEGKILDLHTLPIIYEVPEDVDWCDEENWWKAAPSIDQTVSRDYYREQYEATKHSPQDETRFRCLLLNQWVGAATAWIGSDKWAACKEQFKEEDLHGLDAWIGLDMARKNDLASYVLCIPRGNEIYLLPRFFMPRQNAIHKQKEDNFQYLQHEKGGYITLTDGDVIDPKVIREHLQRDREKFNIVELRYDPYGMEESRQILEEAGFPMLEVPPTAGNLSPSTAYFERLIIDKKIRHGGNPVFNWCLQNTAVKIDLHERIMLDKIKSRGRIDGIVASVIGLTGLIPVAEEGEQAWEGSFFGSF